MRLNIFLKSYIVNKKLLRVNTSAQSGTRNTIVIHVYEPRSLPKLHIIEFRNRTVNNKKRTKTEKEKIRERKKRINTQ